ncbi:MAG: FAD:protein FMN transferase [Chlorobi bacterium]|nr:FAD:protein FMN transferase [Chlorobiota bacterium]
MKKTAGFIIVMILIFFFAWARTEYVQNAFLAADGFAQGTTYHIVVKKTPLKFFLKKDSSGNLKTQIDSILDHFDQSLSTYQRESIISRINRNEPGVTVDTLFKRVFHVSEEIYRESDGAFDITVAPLVSAWGFGPGGPDEQNNPNIDSLLRFVGMDKVHLEGASVIKEDTSVRLDVNAIAQGYSVDVVSGFLDDAGYRNYLVEIGGEIRARGTKGWNNPWKVGVDKPTDNNFIPGQNLQAILKLKDKALATSGNYRKFYIKNGVKYAHTINPKTGYPARNRLLSITVIADECIYADGYATACMVMGVEKSREFIKSKPGLEAYLVYSGDNGSYLTWESDGFSRYMVEEE